MVSGLPASWQVAAHRVRTDEGLALPTNAGRRNFPAVNRIGEELPVCIKLGEDAAYSVICGILKRSPLAL